MPEQGESSCPELIAELNSKNFKKAKGVKNVHAAGFIEESVYS